MRATFLIPKGKVTEIYRAPYATHLLKAETAYYHDERPEPEEFA